jgi:outer membrane receptor protein involved in Fe transport
MRKSGLPIFVTAGAAVAGVFAMSCASAEEDTQGSVLHEVIVTAQKREERAIDVPVSIRAVGADELAERKITKVDDLAAAVPGLAIRSNGSVTREIALRGISNGFGGSSLIAMYLDEASVTSAPSAQLDLAALDLQRVEVLRGPQGTLYGEGAAGGAIRFITRDPILNRFTSSGAVEGLYTEDGAPGERVQGVVNVPVVEDVFGLRLAAAYDHQGGWIDQPAVGKHDINGQNALDVRVKGLWQINPAFKASAMLLAHRNDATPTTGEDANGDFKQVFEQETTPAASDDYELYNLTLNYDFSTFRVLSASSYLDQRKNAHDLGLHAQVFEPPAAPWDLLAAQARDNHIFSEELRANSLGDGPLEWTLGAFYRDAHLDLQGATRIGPQIDPGDPLPRLRTSERADDSKSWAVFTDASYRVLERLKLGAGVRYFEDDQDTLNVVSGARQSGTFHSVNPRIYAMYTLAPEVNLYASAAKGFRSGGFNSDASLPPYDPEKVWTYELGTKMALLDGRIGAELTAFWTDYADYQITGVILLHPELGNLISNAGDARIKGVEGAFNWSPAPGWRLELNGNYLESKFVSIKVSESSFDVGDPVDMFPRYRYTVAAERNFAWGPRSGYVRLDFTRQGRMTYRDRSNGPWYFDESNIIDSLGLHANVQMNEHFAVGFSALNLLNDRGYTSAGIIESLASRNQPRNYGVEFSYSFE